MRHLNYLIIGNSAAGVKAAETLRALDNQASIAIISEEAEPAYSRCLLPEFLGGTRSVHDLRIRPRNFYRRNRIEPILGKRVIKVEPFSKLVILEDDTRLGYDKLLIATGSRSAFPPVPGLEGPGVVGLRNLTDARKILDLGQKARRVVVIGAGFVGLETAYALYKRGLEVTVVEKMPQILPGQFDREAVEIIKRDMHAEGIRFFLGTGIQQVVEPSLWGRLFGKSGRGVILENGERLKAELIIVAAGIKPNTEIVQEAGGQCRRGIVVNKFMQTTVPDLYAAGDVAETEDVVTGKVGITPIWPNAVTQGKIAAFNMAGWPRPYTGSIGMQNAVEFREVPAIAMGITQPASDSFTVLTIHQPRKNLYKKLVLRDDIVVGMILVGDISQAGVIAALMRKKIPVGKYRDDILRGNFNYAYLLK